MKNIIDAVRLLFTTIFMGLGQMVNPIQDIAEKYLRGLLKLALIATLAPIPFALLGIVTGWSWLTACAGLWCTGFFAILSLWGAPIGLLLDSLLQGKRGELVSRTRYINAVRGALLLESLSFWILSIVPIRNHWEFVPLWGLTIVCVTLMTYHWNMENKWLKPILWYSGIGILMLCIVLFFFPKLTESNTQTVIMDWLKHASVKIKTAWLWMESGAWKTQGNAIQAMGIIALITLLVVWLFRRKQYGVSGSSIPDHATGGHGSNPSLAKVVWGCLLLGCAFLVFGSLIQDNRVSRDREVRGGSRNYVPVPKMVSLQITAKSGGYWTLYRVGPHTNLFWSANKPIQFKFGVNEKPQDDVPGSLIRLRPRVGPYTIWFTPGPGISEDVPIDLHLTPM
jgi:hypothetical protein